MGWTGMECTKKEMVARIRDGREHGAEVLASRTTQSGVWQVVKSHADQTPVIVLFLVSSERGHAYYKDMSEDMHPFYYDCPLALLDMAPECCSEWRAKVREWHAQKAQGRARQRDLQVGSVLELPESYNPRTVTLVDKSVRQTIRGGKVRTTTRWIGQSPTGHRYSVPPRIIAAAMSIRNPE